jgi:hypothetical protein
MDVYSAYQDQYIGSVVKVWHGDGAAFGTRAAGSSPHETGSTRGQTQNPHLVHEEGRSVDPTRHVGRQQLGEEMGPFPTMEVGNTGPKRQSAGDHYATAVKDLTPDVLYFAVRPGRLNGGPLTRPLYVPTSAVRSVSMERIVLDVQRDQIPASWRRRPG